MGENQWSHPLFYRLNWWLHIFTWGIAEGPSFVVEATAGWLRFHPVKVVIQPGGRWAGNGCTLKKIKVKIIRSVQFIYSKPKKQKALCVSLHHCSDSLVADKRSRIDLLDQRVVVAAHSPTNSVLALWAAVVQSVLHHEVHRSSSVEILAYVFKVVLNVRVLNSSNTISSSINLLT